MNIKKWIAMGMLCVLVLTGCTKNVESAQVEKEESQEVTTEMTTYKIGVMSDVGAVPFVVAKEKGFFDELGINVEIVPFRSALDRDTALQTGNLDAVMADMLSIVFYTDANLPVKMVAKTAGDYYMLTSPQMDLSAFNQLDIANVGISSNTVIEFTTDYISQQLGISQKINGVAIPQMPVRLEMLNSGELNAATLPDPLASTALAGGGVVVGSTKDYGLFPGILVFNDKILTNESDSIALYDAYNKAAKWLNDKGSSEIYNVLVEELGFSEILRSNWSLPTYEALSAPDEMTFNIVSEWMFKKGLTNQKYDFNAISDSNKLPKTEF